MSLLNLFDPNPPYPLDRNWPLVKQQKRTFMAWRGRSKYETARREHPYKGYEVNGDIVTMPSGDRYQALPMGWIRLRGAEHKVDARPRGAK